MPIRDPRLQRIHESLTAMDQWWDTACHPMGSCLTAWITGDVCVWPVWNNPNDETYWKVKVHNLVSDKWTKTDGRVCQKHHEIIVQILTDEMQEDIKLEQATDRDAIKNRGGF